jgi:hypothetical protein
MVNIPIINANKPRIKPKFLSLLSSFYPRSGCTNKETNDFNQSIADLFYEIHKNNIVFMGADINASIGTR